VYKLQANSGLTEQEGASIITELLASNDKDYVYDYQEHKFVHAFKSGILDSVPAVLEAIRNSLSVASQLGTCGGICVFARNEELDMKEAIDAANWARDSSVNEADLRP
jgi:chaperonin GroEL (HSP60 family)